MREKWFRFQAVALAAALVLTACGGSGTKPTPAAGGDKPAAGGDKSAAPSANSAWDQVIADAKKEGVVVVYSTFPATVEQPLFEKFHTKYGIKVQYNSVGGTEPTLKKWQTESDAGQNLVDVIQLTDRTGGLIVMNQKATAKLEVPNADKVITQFKTREGQLFTSNVLAMPIVYNTTLIKPEDLPKEYKDLTDPKYKGKIALGSPENAASSINMIQAFSELYTWDWIKELAKNKVMETVRQPEAGDVLARGERTLAVIAQTAPSGQIKNGAPLKFLYVPNTIVSESTAFALAKAPHPNAARLFIDFLLSEEFQKDMSEQLGAYSILPSVAPPKGAPKLTELKTYSANADVVLKDRGKIIDQWRAVMK